MTVQDQQDNNNNPFFLSGDGYAEETATIKQDAGRVTGPLVKFTLMAKEAATGKWLPFTDETAVDGTAIPRGIFTGEDISQADIVAGDVVDVPIAVGGRRSFDDDQLVIENAKLLTTVIGAATVEARTVDEALRETGLFAESTMNTTFFTV